MITEPQRGKSRLSLLWDEGDLSAVEDELEEMLDPDEMERSTIDGMLQAGSPPKAVMNKILADRRC